MKDGVGKDRIGKDERTGIPLKPGEVKRLWKNKTAEDVWAGLVKPGKLPVKILGIFIFSRVMKDAEPLFIGAGLFFCRMGTRIGDVGIVLHV